MINHIKELRSAIVNKSPFYASTHTIPTDNCLTKFYFTKDGNIHYADLLNLSHQDIQSLSDACDPATFGLDQKDVLDPSYRRALKMDKVNFCTNFELIQKDIGMDNIGEIKNQLWYSADQPTFIRPEIYKLNVYGKDSFFKKHKDTPRGADMVGSLVVAFPTPGCEGGELVISKDDKSWIWDSAKILKDAPERTITYVAFYSDTDHEVLPVTKGNRITITYNLYHELDNESHTAMPEEDSFQAALSNALQDPEFMPKGGYLGFGLHHMYPVNPKETKQHSLLESLKGSDAMTKRVCENLGLNVELKTVYPNTKYRSEAQIICGNRYPNKKGDFAFGNILTSDQLYENGEDPIDQMKGARMLVKIDVNGNVEEPNFKDCYTNPHLMPVLWVNENVKHTEFSTPHVRYGNEATLGYTYSYICLMARVDVPGDREKMVPQKRRKLEG